MSTWDGRPPADFRSDTVTRPSDTMRKAMAEAEVGDDFYGEDPTVAALEERAADLLGTEAALLVVGGTMANLCAVMALAPRGTDVVAEADSDLLRWESHSMAARAGVRVAGLRGRRGVLPVDGLRRLVARDDPRAPRTGLVAVENTHSASGGCAWPLDALREVSATARAAGVPVLCDGARLLNAVLFTGYAPSEPARWCDAVTLSLYKGLGAPMGALVAGSRALVDEARATRRLLGATLRQAGVFAAAGLVALDEWHRLAGDHELAQRLRAGLVPLLPAPTLCPRPPETNIVPIRLDDAAPEFVARLAGLGVLVTEVVPGMVRFVTHRDVDEVDVDRAVDAVARVAAEMRIDQLEIPE